MYVCMQLCPYVCMCAVVCVVHVCKCVPRCPLVPDYSVPHQKRGQLRISRRAVGAGNSDHGTCICKCMAVQSASDARPNASRRCLRTEHQKPKGEPNSPTHVPKNASEAGCDGRAWRRQGSETTDPGTAARIEGEGPGRADGAKGGVPATPEAESKRRKIAKAGPAPRAHAKTLSPCMQNVALFIEKPLQSAMSGSAFPSGRGPSRRAGFEVLFVP